MTIPSLEDVQNHAAHTPWVEEGEQLVAAVVVKMQVRSAGGTIFDIDTLQPAEDQDMAYEIQEAATIRVGRARYLERKDRLVELEREKEAAIMGAIRKISVEVGRIGECILPLGLSIWLAVPPAGGGDDPAADQWPPVDSSSTPPLP